MLLVDPLGGRCMEQSRATKQEENQENETRSETKVHEMAENMEHTLRRLAKQKDRARAMSPVQYLRK